MKQNILKLALAAAALGAASSAHAGFINGGFETGDFSGWTLEHGTTYGGALSAGGAGHAYIIGTGYNDPYSPFDSPFNGNYMARLNEFSPGYDVTRISQTGIMQAGETSIFVNWGAVLEDPNHAPGDQPYFLIEILKNNVLFGSTNNVAGAGWTQVVGGGPNTPKAFYSSGQYSITGLVAGDSVTVRMTVADCDLGGHSGWAYLDGIGTVAQQPPPNGVPDNSATLFLLAPALLGFVAFRRRK